MAYFDNAATTFPKPEEVYVAMDRVQRELGVNVGRGQYALASRGAALVSETRELLQSVLHCENKEIVFTSSATEAMNVILQGISWDERDTIYISPFEHNAVTRCLHYICSQHGISVEILKVDPDSLEFDIVEIERQFEVKNPTAVIMSHASNTCGVVAPAMSIFAAAKEYKAITVLDMAQSAGLVDLQVGNDLIDFAVFAGHKTLYGPFGIGGFATSRKVGLKPLIYGGTGVDSANQDMPKELPTRYEAGSPNIGAIAGLNAALHWAVSMGLDVIREKEKANHRKLLEVLERYSDFVSIIKPKGESVGVVSCTFMGYASDNIGNVLSNHDVCVRTGLHCAPYAHRFLGTFPAGTVRLSVSYFTGDDDFSVLDDALSFIEDNI